MNGIEVKQKMDRADAGGKLAMEWLFQIARRKRVSDK
jgi:hypothetical protein